MGKPYSMLLRHGSAAEDDTAERKCIDSGFVGVGHGNAGWYGELAERERKC